MSDGHDFIYRNEPDELEYLLDKIVKDVQKQTVEKVIKILENDFIATFDYEDLRYHERMHNEVLQNAIDEIKKEFGVEDE